jgi:immune inhibitor A
LLFGFPDLYDTTGNSEGMGNWCLMSGGSWNNNGLTPAHPSAWCKMQQGWVSVDIPKGSQAGVLVEDVKTSFNVKKIWKNGLPGNEYFLMENRQQGQFDQYLPGSGLLIWHIDEAMPDNTNRDHYKVALVQADGLKNLENSNENDPASVINRGDDGDPYPGSSGKTVFNYTSDPSSRSYGGLDSSVQVLNIAQSGAAISCNIQVS